MVGVIGIRERDPTTRVDEQVLHGSRACTFSDDLIVALGKIRSATATEADHLQRWIRFGRHTLGQIAIDAAPDQFGQRDVLAAGVRAKSALLVRFELDLKRFARHSCHTKLLHHRDIHHSTFAAIGAGG